MNKKELFKAIGYLGAALLISGAFRYYAFETWQKWEKIMVGAGGALLLLSLIVNFAEIKAVWSRRSTKLGANTVTMTLAVIAILGLLNFLGYRHSKRFDLSEEKLYSLSDQTKQILSNLKQDVKIMHFDKQDDPVLRERVQEYKALSRRISYEFVDPQEKPDVAQQHKITSFNQTIVVAGDRIERTEGIEEQDITNAILKATRNQTKIVYFVEGHQEKSLTDSSGEGYRAIENALKNENYEVKSVNLVTTNQVPSDASVLVVAGPKQGLFPQEASMIAKYLDEGGKVMLLVDPDTKPQLDEIFKKWGVEVGDNTIIDVSGVGRLFGTGPAVPMVSQYGSHQITRNFQGTMTFFPLARSVKRAADAPSDVMITELLNTSAQSWAETDLTLGGQVEFTEGKDTKGPISLGIVADKKVGQKQARLVVIGDSDFATDRYVGMQRNGDLFLNSINWLAGDEDLISVRPKEAKDRRVTLTQTQQNLLAFFNYIFLPLLVLGAGVSVWWRRR